MSASQYENDELVFLDEDVNFNSELGGSQGYWNLLVVDDDEEIHSITKLALSDLVLDNKKLRFYHAYSGQQAMELLAKLGNEVAIVLLDVVMETDDAGLEVARALRNDLQLHEPRIVLRTGQPGYAPEDSVIKQYDINDYKTKTELTRSRLITTIISSLRSYQQLRKITRSREGLEQIVQVTPMIMEKRNQGEFCQETITQISRLLGLSGSGVMFATSDKPLVNAVDVSVLGTQGKLDDLMGANLTSVGNEELITSVLDGFNKKQHIVFSNCVVFYLASRSHQLVIYFELDYALDLSMIPLVDVLLSSVAVGFENVSLLHRLEVAAYKDWLTNLSNRNEFISILNQVSSDKQDQVVAFVDIKHFSDINDGLGQEVGNHLLLDVGRRLVDEFKDEVTLGRIDADVFGLLGDHSRINPTVINRLFFKPFVVGEHILPISVQIGLSRISDDKITSMDTLKRANIALNQAKKHVSENYMYFCESMEEETAQRLNIIRQLRADFEEQRLTLWYQPQIELHTGRLVGMEALLRWQTRDGNFIPPDQFIPLAEYSGLIINIGDWVLEQACAKLRHLNKLGFSDCRMAVNISMPQFRNHFFVSSLKQVVENHNIDPRFLELEITESILMDEPDLVLESLAVLKEFGVKIAIDDFGTGFSSMSYLNKLPIDRLKIDREFISQYETGKSAAIAENIVILGKKLGLQTVAEGVETDEQAAYLNELGCDDAQGYLYAKPMPFDALVEFVKSYRPQ